ncbi:MAG: tyrosine-protein phosphatase [Clostridia bacterium]|nr:tyrosine-protein phosphatase [Clostridia bacterium]
MTSSTACFTTSADGPRNVCVDGITNFRDLGGYKTEQGKHIKQGLIYRCARRNESNNETPTLCITFDEMKTLTSQLGERVARGVR